MEYKFSPSLMCMNLLKLEEQIKFMNQKAAFYHVDIMDGHYVKNITLSPYFISQIRGIATVPIDAHLMAEHPSDFIDMILDAGADMISPHAETINREAFRIINMIKDRGRKVGIVLNPATPLDYIKHYIHLLDKITILTVDPGFAGQKFIPEMLDKIKEAKELKNKYGYSYLIEVDGAVNQKTFKALKEAGTEVFILGSSGLFNNDPDIGKAWEIMLEQFNNAC